MTAPDIRAQAIEVLARALFDAASGGLGDTDEPFDAWASAYRHKAAPYVDALAEAGLLATPSAGFAVLLTSDSGATSLSAAGSLAREMAEERVAYLRGGAFDARVVELREAQR